MHLRNKRQRGRGAHRVQRTASEEAVQVATKGERRH